MWEEDWIGLRELHETGRLYFYSGPGEHMDKDLNMIEDYLAPLLRGDPYPLPSEI